MMIEGDYLSDGAVCVRQAFSRSDVELAREAIEANLADLSPLAKRASADDDAPFVEDFCNWQRFTHHRAVHSSIPPRLRLPDSSPAAVRYGFITIIS